MTRWQREVLHKFEPSQSNDGNIQQDRLAEKQRSEQWAGRSGRRRRRATTTTNDKNRNNSRTTVTLSRSVSANAACPAQMGLFGAAGAAHTPEMWTRLGLPTHQRFVKTTTYYELLILLIAHCYIFIHASVGFPNLICRVVSGNDRSWSFPLISQNLADWASVASPVKLLKPQCFLHSRITTATLLRHMAVHF